jgi:hypothetical protein
MRAIIAVLEAQERERLEQLEQTVPELREVSFPSGVRVVSNDKLESLEEEGRIAQTREYR